MSDQIREQFGAIFKFPWIYRGFFSCYVPMLSFFFSFFLSFFFSKSYFKIFWTVYLVSALANVSHSALNPTHFYLVWNSYCTFFSGGVHLTPHRHPPGPSLGLCGDFQSPVWFFPCESSCLTLVTSVPGAAPCPAVCQRERAGIKPRKVWESSFKYFTHTCEKTE